MKGSWEKWKQLETMKTIKFNEVFIQRIENKDKTQTRRLIRNVPDTHELVDWFGNKDDFNFAIINETENGTSFNDYIHIKPKYNINELCKVEVDDSDEHWYNAQNESEKLVIKIKDVRVETVEGISKEADEFRVRRRIVFMNTMTDTYLFSVEGNCSITADMEDEQLEVTCKIGDNSYQKHFFGLSPTVTYTVEQLEWIDVDKYKYELIFKPEQIIPVTIDVE